MPRKHARSGSSNRHISRRRWMQMLGIGGAAGLAGCSGGGGGTGTGTSTSTGTEEEGMGQETSEVGDTDELPEVSGTYNAVTSSNFTTLNPIYNSEAGAGAAIGYALDSGYTFDGNQEYFPLHYDMSTDNGQVWTFEVRENLQFSDPYGQVTAEDYVYLIQEVHKSDWANTVSSSNWQGVNVEQTGEFEFQAELQSTQVLWPQSYDPLMYPAPKDLLKPYVDEQDAQGLKQDEELLELKFTGNLGAFTMDKWERGAGTTYSRNDDYYLQEIDEGPDIFSGAPFFEGVEVSVVEEQSSRLGALETGEADSASVPPERFEEFQEKDQVQVLQVPQPYNEIIAVNQRGNGWTAGPGNLFQLKPFRQAMAAAINKQKIIEGIFRGRATEHHTWQPSWSQFYPENTSEIPKFGTEQYGKDAAQSLAQDAFSMSEYDYKFDGDRMVTPEGDQVTLTAYHSSGQETEKLLTEFAAQELDANLGINVEVNAIDGTRFNNEYWIATETAEPGTSTTIDGEEVTWDRPTQWNPGPRDEYYGNNEWDMSLVFGLNTYPRNPLTNQVFFDGYTSLYNPVGYYPTFDAADAFKRARQAESVEEAKSAFNDLFVGLGEDQPYIMMVFTDDLVGYNSDLVGPIENFSNGWDFPGWHFEDS